MILKTIWKFEMFSKSFFIKLNLSFYKSLKVKKKSDKKIYLLCFFFRNVFILTICFDLKKSLFPLITL